MFMTRARFEEAGCFPDQRMMEDFELTRNLRRRVQKARWCTAFAAVCSLLILPPL